MKKNKIKKRFIRVVQHQLDPSKFLIFKKFLDRTKNYFVFKLQVCFLFYFIFSLGKQIEMYPPFFFLSISKKFKYLFYGL